MGTAVRVGMGRMPEDALRAAGIDYEICGGMVTLRYKGMSRVVTREIFEDARGDEKHMIYIARSLREEFENEHKRRMSRMTPPLGYGDPCMPDSGISIKTSGAIGPRDFMEKAVAAGAAVAPQPKQPNVLLLLTEEDV